MTANGDKAAQLRSLITIKRRVLVVLEQQAAILATAAPPHVVLQIEDTTANLPRPSMGRRPETARRSSLGLLVHHIPE